MTQTICEVCGEPTTSKYGVCHRKSRADCLREWHRRQHTFNRTHNNAKGAAWRKSHQDRVKEVAKRDRKRQAAFLEDVMRVLFRLHGSRCACCGTGKSLDKNAKPNWHLHHVSLVRAGGCAVSHLAKRLAFSKDPWPRIFAENDLCALVCGKCHPNGLHANNPGGGQLSARGIELLLKTKGSDAVAEYTEYARQRF